MSTLLVALALVAVAVAVAAVLRRRQPDAPTQAKWRVPVQLDRADFGAAEPWLVVVFTSSTCDSCSQAVTKATVLASPVVAVQEIAYQARRDLHERYFIDAVPTTVVADDAGVVRASFVGVPTATDLWAAVAEAREPGSSPEPGLGH